MIGQRRVRFMRRFILPLGAAILLGSGLAARAADPEFQRLGKEGDFSLTPPEVTVGPEAGWYLRGDVGYVVPQMGAVSVGGAPLAASSDLSSGWSLGAAFGYRFDGPFRLEAGVDYLGMGHSDTAAGALGVDATVAMASLYWDVIDIAGFTPYVGGGVGFAIVNLDSPPGITASGNDWGLAFSLAAGVNYAITSQWSIDVGYRYIDLGSRTVAAPASPTTLDVESLSAHQIRLGFRYQAQ